MTVNVLYTVWCDGPNESGGPGNCGEWVTHDTAWEARDVARALGWECGKKLKSRDLCPKHAEPEASNSHASVSPEQTPSPAADSAHSSDSAPTREQPKVLRVQITDLLTGDTDTAEIPAGEYLILTTEPCHVAGTQAYPAKGTHVITVRGRTAP